MQMLRLSKDVNTERYVLFMFSFTIDVSEVRILLWLSYNYIIVKHLTLVFNICIFISLLTGMLLSEMGGLL